MKQYRCKCNKLLFMGILTQGTQIEIKCQKCKKLNIIKESLETENKTV
jgi:phage FluMu protein Com